jgi:hypothetical protein
VADVAPKHRTTPREKIAQLVRLLSTSVKGERANAWRALERSMENAGVSWSDVGNWIEHGGEHDDGKYSEAEMQEFAQAARAEGVDAGIKIGMTRATGAGGNGHLTLPSPVEMADFCHARRRQLKDDKQREFVDDMIAATRRFGGHRLQRGTLGYLASLYIKHGGKT